MPRKKRTWYPGAIYHVMSRGNRRVSLYKEEDDYLSFIEGVKKARLLYPFRIHSMCMMTNHFHMLLETENIELWKIMNRILHPYAMNFNRKYHYTGHLFEDRYTACLIEDEKYLLEVSRYIHLNPVKAQMVREPIAYEYTSYGKFVTPVLGDKEGYSTKKVTAMMLQGGTVQGMDVPGQAQGQEGKRLHVPHDSGDGSDHRYLCPDGLGEV